MSLSSNYATNHKKPDSSIANESNMSKSIPLTETNASSSSNHVNTTTTSTQQNFSFLGLDGSSFSSGGDGGSSFGLDNTSFGIVTNSTSQCNQLDISALHQTSNAFTVDSVLSLGLGDKNNKKTAKKVKKMLLVHTWQSK